MNARRLVPLGLLVAVLLAAAGIASHGRPLAGGRGTGPTATFFDYVATTLILVALVFLAVAVWSLLSEKNVGGGPPRGRWNLVTALLSFAVSALIAVLLLHTGFINRLRNLEQNLNKNQQTHTTGKPPPAGRNVRNPHLRWDEIAVFVALIAGTGIVIYANRRTRRTPRPWRFGRNEEVAQALDESIDDLRNDPDLRRAIIAAYARMEHALARAGIARRPSEAPFEYMERALRSLDTSADGAQRLTGLFEWAKFSHHEPEPPMRDEAIAALVAVRDELAREPVAV
ncbi:MAG TPA: DUF4129 domain-containing protein [Gaiellaceae bacterium]|jgi:hypothetical protein